MRACMTVKDMDSMSFDELKSEFINFRKVMMKHIEEQEKQIQKYKKDNEELQINIKDLQFQLVVEKEKYKQLVSARYQSQRNQVVLDMPTLFDDVEEEALKVEESETEEVITVGEHKRVRRPKEKHISYEHLPKEDVYLPVPDGEDICDVCGSKMTVKKYDIKEELVIEPVHIYVRVTHVPVLECENCQSINDEGKSSYHKINHNFLFERSMCSPEMLAYIIDQKYNNGLPLYTLEKMFLRDKLIVPRQNMANWVIGSMRYLEPLYNLMKEDLLKMSLIHADETRTQVLNEAGKPSTSTSYMWVYRSNKYEVPIVLYDYRSTRSGDCPQEFLKGYSGYLETDAYDGYNKVPNIVRCLCNVHALRKFKDAYKLLPNNKERKTSDEAIAIKKYDEIIHQTKLIEEKASEKYKDSRKRLEYITKRRQEELKPRFEKFLSWLEEIEPRNKGKYSMSKAIQYVLNHKEGLMAFTENAIIPHDNTSCERSIRPFVVIRNRCKFSVSEHGAQASAMIYSLVISCIENKQNPYMYFTHLFEHLPNLDLTNKEELRKFLPYSKELPSYIRTLSKSEIKAILSKSQE